jgi:hypothetical protein
VVEGIFQVKTLDLVTPEDLSDPGTLQAAYTEVCDAFQARHAKEAQPRRLELRGFCRCGYPSIGNGGTLCHLLDDLGNIDMNNLADWLTRAKKLRDEALKGA